MVGEVLGFNLWAVVCVHMVTVKAPPDDVAQVGFGTSAFAIWPLVPPLDERRVVAGSHRFRNIPFLLF